MKHSLNVLRAILAKTRCVDFLPLLLLRLYLVPIFWMAGTNKIMHMPDTVAWFGNPEWGLGLPFPWLLAHLAAYTEVIGAIFLLFGFLTRWISIPLIITMLVAIFAVHWDNGWMAIAGNNHPGTIQLNEFLAWLQEANPGKYDNLTDNAQLVVLQNGIEFASTYFVMLLVLFFYGAGKYFSVDYWVARQLDKE